MIPRAKSQSPNSNLSKNKFCTCRSVWAELQSWRNLGLVRCTTSFMWFTRGILEETGWIPIFKKPLKPLDMGLFEIWGYPIFFSSKGKMMIKIDKGSKVWDPKKVLPRSIQGSTREATAAVRFIMPLSSFVREPKTYAARGHVCWEG